MPKDELKNLMDKTPALKNNWDETYGDRMQKLVFIGQHMDKTAIEGELNQCLVK